MSSAHQSVLFLLIPTCLAGTITFDDISAGPSLGAPIPNGYQALNWNNFWVEYGPANLLSGYAAGIVSSPNVAFNGAGNPASFSSASPFTLASAYFTAAWNDGLDISIQGKNGGTVVDKTDIVVSATAPTQVSFNWGGLTEVDFSSSGGTFHTGYFGAGGSQFVMDNLAIVPSGPSCASVLNNAVNVSLGGYGRSFGNPLVPTDISATFTPNFGLSLAQAAAICGVSAFDWQQTITSIPDPSPVYTFSGQHLTSASAPWLDPPPNGGYNYCQPGSLKICDGYPFYYSPARLATGCAEYIFAGICGTDMITGNTLHFFDAPSDPLLPPGTAEFFQTQLVGVIPGAGNGTAVPLGTTWTWSDSFNGTSGGIAQTLSYSPVDPGSGTGGITIQSADGVVITPEPPPFITFGIAGLTLAAASTIRRSHWRNDRGHL